MRPLPLVRRGLAALLCAAALASCGGGDTPYYQGYVEGEFVYVASPVAGRLETLAVRRGQQVAARAPLYALEAVSETATRDQARAQRDAAQARLDDSATGKRPEEVDVNRARLAQAEAAAQRSAAQLVRDEAQLRAGGVSRGQLDDSRAQARADAARVRELRAQLLVDALPGRSALRRAETAETQAADAALAQAEWTLAQTRGVAPAAGLVFDTLYRQGEWVAAGSPVVSLLPPGNVKVRFFVPAAVAGGLRAGQRASVRCEGCGEPVPVRIDYVSTQAEYTPPVIYSRETRDKLVYLVEARPDPADAARLHPGQPVEATLQ